MKRSILLLFLLAFLAYPVTNVLGKCLYGAIAYSQTTGESGVDHGYPEKEGAIDGAMRECEDSDCKCLVIVCGDCGALTRGSNGVLGMSSKCKEKEEAIRKALDDCRKKGGVNCMLVRYVCSFW